ncbi:MAG: LysR family transcriptional regulator [Litorivicinaceae bacterium]|nr:MAG: LysR family transcriptional regulator [Litorivicinaceae bacterium]
MSVPRLKLKLALDDNDTLLGPGKIALLKAIQKEHSLSQAAKSINMSYRRAWLLIQELNDSLKDPVLISKTGGQSGGGSELTAMANQIIDIYEQLTREAEGATEATRESIASLLK